MTIAALQSDGNRGPTPADPAVGRVDSMIGELAEALRQRQAPDGHWLFDLEADTTIPAEYIMLEHYLDDIDPTVEAKLARYLRDRQGEHGGWPLFYGGAFNISASVKAYLALKLVGDDPDAPHMCRARAAILAQGGAATANVFTRVALALFGQVPWRATPTMPIEIMLLPAWSPFHIDKVSYWSRTVMVPLLVLMALKPEAANPRRVDIAELFTVPPDRHPNYQVNPTGSRTGELFLWLDKALKVVEPLFPEKPRQRALDAAVAWFTARMNGEHGLGGIFPAMANTVMALAALGYPREHPLFRDGMMALRKLLLVDAGESGYCQPCVSPIWDTGLALLAMLEAGEAGDGAVVRRACDWLRDRQINDVVGDWAVRRPGLAPGGWAFQYENAHYPDVDDTAAVAMGLHRADPVRYREALERAEVWILGMQSKNGGWGSFDADNTHYHLNHIPFADHGALLDPPTADVSARCIGMLAQLGHDSRHPAVARGVDYLKREQEANGSWFGRWGSNYVYGTWSVLAALNAAGEDMRAPYVRRAVAWLAERQNSDGGWGEELSSYEPEHKDRAAASTPSQTAWAVLAMMAAGEVAHPAVRRGIAYLVDQPHVNGRLDEPWYTGVGFPRVFYLRYHGYAAYFPLWALARYRNLTRGNTGHVPHGI
ncbi:MAG: squalene--hopene cyclase [Alphaproteobacteria bacterium]|nr:squalene--hopene cyclase [Alphaproteobacteria bacterium]